MDCEEYKRADDLKYTLKFKTALSKERILKLLTELDVQALINDDLAA